MKSVALAALLLLTALAPGQVLERTISLRDTLGWLRGEQSFAYDSRRELAYLCADRDSMLFVLDSKTNAKKARIPVPSGITGMVYDSIDDRLLCVRAEADSVAVLDCGTWDMVASIPVGDEPVSVCYANRVNKAYTVSDGDMTASVLDCGSMAELARLPVWAEELRFVYNRVTNTVWCHGVGGDTLWVIDCGSDSVVARLDLAGVWQVDYDRLTGTVYCSTRSEDYVTVIDGANYNVRDRIAAEGEVWGVACAWRRGLLYMIQECGFEVYNCHAGEIVQTVAYYSEDDYGLVQYSPGADVIWLAWSGCFCGPGHVAVIDCATNGVFQGPGVYNPLALHPAANGQTYLCGDDDPLLILKDANSMFASVVSDRFRLSSLACNALDGRVYASGDPPTVLVIDQLLDTIFVHPGIDYLSGADVNSIDNKLYGFHWMAHSPCTDLVVYDGVEQRVSSRIPTGDDPSAVCVNSREDKVYCGSWGGRDLRVYDGHSDSMLARFDLGFSVSALGLALIENKLYCGGYTDAIPVIDCARDIVTRKVYIPRVESEFCYSPAARRMYYLTDYGRELKAIDCQTDTIVSSLTLPGSGRFIYLNSRENKLYVPLPESGRIAVVSCGADTLVAQIAVGSAQPYGYMEACYDAEGDKLYCPVSADTCVAVIDGKCDSLIKKLKTGLSPVGVTFDPGTGRLFVANPGEGTISVFRDSVSVSRHGTGALARIPTMARGWLIMPAPHTGQLLDITGRVVLALHAGLNDVRALAPGVYFVREAAAQAQAHAVRKVVIAK